LADLSCGEFQETVSEYLVRHRSVLDVMSKLQEAGARVNRAVAKSVTSCGCLEVSAQKQKFPENATLADLKRMINSHISGELCPECREALETELGQMLFYIAALCAITGLDLDEIMMKEHDRLRMLGLFNLT
jgi:hydrogenase/urease accessory protein HupE